MSAPDAPQADGRGGGYALAFGAAAAYGTAAVLIRRGLLRYGSPLTAIVVALVVGVLALAPLALAAWRGQGAGWRPERRALLFVLASGLSAMIGFGANTYALSRLPVVVVSPISSAFPLVTVLLARVFLRGSERVNGRTIAGAALIVAGVILVTLSRR